MLPSLTLPIRLSQLLPSLTLPIQLRSQPSFTRFHFSYSTRLRSQPSSSAQETSAATGQVLATKRLKHNNELYYKTLHQYNELFKSHETYLDTFLLANSFHNLFLNTSTSKSRNLFAYKKLSSQISVLQPYKIAFNQPLDANKLLHPPQTMAPSSPSCASPSLDNCDTSITDDPLDNPDNDAISDMSINDNNDAISETSIDDNNDDPIPIDEIEEPFTLIIFRMLPILLPFLMMHPQFVLSIATPILFLFFIFLPFINPLPPLKMLTNFCHSTLPLLFLPLLKFLLSALYIYTFQIFQKRPGNNSSKLNPHPKINFKHSTLKFKSNSENFLFLPLVITSQPSNCTENELLKKLKLIKISRTK